MVRLAAKIGWSGESADDLFNANVQATRQLAHLAKEWGLFHFCLRGINCEHFCDSHRCKFARSPGFSLYGFQMAGRTRYRRRRHFSCTVAHRGCLRMARPHPSWNKPCDSECSEWNPPTLVGRGLARRNYIYVEDLALFICYIAEQKKVGKIGVAAHQSERMVDMIQYICDILLDGQAPTSMNGPDAKDQIIAFNEDFPTRSFRDALTDIKRKAQSAVPS